SVLALMSPTATTLSSACSGRRHTSASGCQRAWSASTASSAWPTNPLAPVTSTRSVMGRLRYNQPRQCRDKYFETEFFLERAAIGIQHRGVHLATLDRAKEIHQPINLRIDDHTQSILPHPIGNTGVRTADRCNKGTGIHIGRRLARKRVQRHLILDRQQRPL